MSQYAYLIAGVVLGVAGLVAVYLFQTRRDSIEEPKRSWLSYLLIWPLILDVDAATRKGEFLTKREFIGWGIVIVVAICAIILT